MTATITFLLQRHMALEHGGKTFPCTECEYVAYIPGMLKLHQNTHKPNQYQCKHCAKRLKSKESLQRHEWIHSDTKPYRYKNILPQKCPHIFFLSLSLLPHTFSPYKQGEPQIICPQNNLPPIFRGQVTIRFTGQKHILVLRIKSLILYSSNQVWDGIKSYGKFAIFTSL